MTEICNYTAKKLSSFISITTTEEAIEILIDLNQQHIGGYEYEVTDELPIKYVCMICTNIHREPVLVSCCGQHFCLSCLEKCFSVNERRCPHCLAKELQYFVNKQHQRDVKELRVKCCNADRGCVWIGRLGDMDYHISKQCKRLTIYCPENCGVKVDRCELHEHLKMSHSITRENSCE